MERAAVSMTKRIFGLAAAGAVALMLGGAYTLTAPPGRASAAGATTIVAGCAQGNNPNDIEFPTNGAGGAINGAQTQPFFVFGSAAPATPLVLNAINVQQPQAYLECAALLQDTLPLFGVGVAGQDGNLNTVDGGSVVYTLLTVGGRFAILDNLSASVSKTCGSDGVGPIAAPQTGAGYESCEGAIPVSIPVAGGTAGAVVPNPNLIIKVGLMPGVPQSAFGSLTGVQGANAGFTLTATYQRYNDLNIVGAFGPSTSSVTLNLGLGAPSYAMGLTASPTTVSANPNPAMAGVVVAGAAQGGNTGGSTITASLYTVNSNPATVGLGSSGSIVVAGGGTLTATGGVQTTGAEPGTVTFSTNAGVFGAPASPSASALQTVAVACGVLPGTNPIYNPQTFSFRTYAFNSCQSVTAVLYGGGAAGQATVVAVFVGNVTGQQAQNAVFVGFGAAGNTGSLIRGCNEAVTPASLSQGTPITTYLTTISPASVVAAIWQFNNATQGFAAAYFSMPNAPANGNTIGPNQSVFICVAGPASVPNGA